MKVVVNYKQTDEPVIKIETVQYVGDFLLNIKFNDGTEKKVDFKPFLEKSLHPSIQKYHNENNFLCYQILDGNLIWNDYDMVFPVWDLYNGKIEI